MQIYRAPASHLRPYVSGYWGFEERTSGPMRRHEGPGRDVVLILSFGNEWLIDGQRRESFVGGLRSSQVETEHAGWSCGMHVGLAPWAAAQALAVPLHELANTTAPLDDELVDRLAQAVTWDERFALLDDEVTRRFADVRPVPPEVVWAWTKLLHTHGCVRIASLTEELGWSRKRLVARFRDYIGLPPKAVARLLRFERARSLAGSVSWGELAFTCGYADQPHLISEFRAFTGRTPETFLQDEIAAAA